MEAVGRDASDRVAAHIAAYQAWEDGQTSRGLPRLAEQVATARDRDWPEVACILALAQYTAETVAGRPDEALRGPVHTMLELAEQDGDPALMGLALSCSSELYRLGEPQERVVDRAEELLARAVVVLELPGGREIDRATAYLSCAASYSNWWLYELEAQMLEHAQVAIQNVPDTHLPIRQLQERPLAVNRIGSALMTACECAEIGRRDAAAAIATDALEVMELDVATLPADWRPAMVGMLELLAAFARRPLSAEDTSADGSLLLLAEAIRQGDRGDESAAADLAERALDGGSGALPFTFALSLAARRPPVSSGAERYAGTLARHAWRTRLQATTSARARIETERMRAENRHLTQRAFVDELTGLPNRHAYNRDLERLHQRSDDPTVAVLVIDVDWFKQINDTHGHPAGDQVLRVLGQILAQHTRPTDLAARLGGDEFVVLIVDRADRPLADALATRLAATVRDHPWPDVHPGLRVTISVGAAVGPVSRMTEIFGAADRNLYQAKEGRPAPQPG